MGVPGFYRWLVQRYPTIRKRLSDPSRPVINNLFIDANGIVHLAYQTVGNTGIGLSPELFSEICRYIDLIVQMIQPTDLIYFVLDGCSPFSKANTQRARRYAGNENPNPEKFDRNHISPGSEFADQLNDALIEFFKSRKETDAVWKKPKFAFSGFYVPGEGEHKILEYIRSQRSKPEWNPNQVHCIYSNDADLIFLSLQTHEPNICVLRELSASNYKKDYQPFEARESQTNWSFEFFELLYISLIREYFMIDFKLMPEQLESFIDDFIAISFVIGNDFIPAFNDIEIRKGDFNRVVDMYKDFYEKFNSNLVINGKIDKKILYDFFEFVVKSNQVVYNHANQIPDEADPFSSMNKKFIMDRYPEQATSDFDSLICSMSKSILDGFDWVIEYYNSGCPSWEWSYPYLFSPPLQFVLPYIKDHTSKFIVGEPLDPLLHQLIILGPYSKSILPPCLADLMNPGSPISQYYPATFDYDTNNRTVKWQSIPILPIIDIELMKSVYKAAKESIPAKYQRFNRTEEAIEINADDVILFKHSNGPRFSSDDLSTSYNYEMPTLNTIRFSTETRVVPVRVFEWPSHNASIVIKIGLESLGSMRFPNAASVIPFIGKEVLIGYPYLKSALIVGATDDESYIGPDSNNELVAKKSLKFQFSGEKQKNSILTTTGIEIESNCFLIVRPMELFSSNGLEKGFSTKTDYYPAAITLLPEESEYGVRYLKRPEVLPVPNEKVILNNESAKGCLANIVCIEDNGFATVEILRRNLIDGVVKIINDDKKFWDSFESYKSELKIKYRVFCIATSSVMVTDTDTNIALTLSLPNPPNRVFKVVEGWCKRSSRDLFFFSPTKNLIKEYFLKAGNLKKLLIEAVDKQADKFEFSIDQLFEGENHEAKVQKYNSLIDWLSQNSPCVKSNLVSSYSDSLTIKGISQIETLLEKYQPKETKSGLEKIPISKIIWSGMQKENIKCGEVSLGSKVYSIASSGPVPFGTSGVVISYDSNANTADVVFDQVLPYGTNLNGRLKKNRGMKMTIYDLYVISK